MTKHRWIYNTESDTFTCFNCVSVVLDLSEAPNECSLCPECGDNHLVH